MADTRETIENVKSLARTFQSVIDLAAALEGVADVEQAVRSAQVQLARTRNDLADLQDQREALAADIAKKHEQARTIVQDAEHVAVQTRTAARTHHDEQIALAQTTAAAIVKKAREEAEHMEAQREFAEGKRNAAQVELDDIETRISKAKDRMAKMLGA